MVNGNGEKIKVEILELLKKNPEGLTIANLSEKLEVHRQTATKYVFELKGAGKIRIRAVGSATLIYINGVDHR